VATVVSLENHRASLTSVSPTLSTARAWAITLVPATMLEESRTTRNDATGKSVVGVSIDEGNEDESVGLTQLEAASTNSAGSVRTTWNRTGVIRVVRREELGGWARVGGGREERLPRAKGGSYVYRLRDERNTFRVTRARPWRAPFTGLSQ
jgi:hypothetical protein